MGEVIVDKTEASSMKTAQLRDRAKGNITIRFYDSETKRRREISTGTNDQKDAEAIREDLISRWRRGDFDPFENTITSRTTLAELIDLFLEEKRQADLRPATIRTYKYLLNQFSSHVGESRQIASITRGEVCDFVTHGDVKQTTKAHRLRHVRAFYNYLYREDIIQDNPTDKIDVKSNVQTLPEPVREGQLEAICEAVREDYKKKSAEGKAATGEIIWYERAFRLAFYTGLRARELGRMRWRDVDLEREKLRIPVQKSGKQTVLPLSEQAVEVLAEIGPGHPEDFVVKGPRQGRTRNQPAFVNNLSRAFRKYRDEAEIDSITLHGLRHGFCTKLAEAGKSAFVIKELARHANVTTSQVYVHMAADTLRNELDGVFG